jgi:uncharacterized protein
MASSTPNKVNRSTFITVMIVLYAFLLLVATAWSHFGGIPLLPKLQFSYQPVLIGAGVGMLTGFGGYLLYLATRKQGFGRLRELVEDYLAPMVAELKPSDIVIVAVLSGFVEEVFFRGVAQHVIGVPLAALAFGLLHDPTLRHPAYSIITFFAGLVFGYLMVWTGSLWAPIVAHIIHNLIAMYLVRYRIKPPAAPA